MKKFLCFLFAAAVIAVRTGCSSPYLPHNAIKYIPELSEQSQETESKNDNSQLEGESSMDDESQKDIKSYFSPGSIRERYADHIKCETDEKNDPIFEIAKKTVSIMRRDGKSDEEIQSFLKEKYHFSQEIIDTLIN